MSRLLTKTDFIEKSSRKHGGKYDYSLVNCTTRYDKVNIICKKHGVFSQTAYHHYVIGSGCKKCATAKAIISTIKKAKVQRNTIHIPPLPLDVIGIPLTSGKYAIIDKIDFEKVNIHNWSARKGGGYSWYASATINGKKCSLHRFILNLYDEKQIVDHIDRNGLNNTRNNLRLCNPSENRMNTLAYTNAASKYKGVYKQEYKGNITWISSIQKNRKRIYIGSFREEVEAAKAYDRMAKELFGEFAYLNFET